jgi:hypothetical protein
MILTENPYQPVGRHAFRDHAQPLDRTTIDRLMGAKFVNESTILFRRKTIFPKAGFRSAETN